VKLIDHTLLRPGATETEIAALVRDAREYGFHAVCVNPFYVRLTKRLLEGSGVKVCTVIGFPLGATLPGVKAREAEIVGRAGADEVDMVINIGALKSGMDDIVYDDIRAVVRSFKSVVPKGVVKVILEVGLLSREEIEAACLAAEEAGADFVKTCTGFGPRGATVEDVALLKRLVGGRLGIKAAGGIRSYEQALRLIEAGATRIGTSSGVKIAKEAPE